MVAAKRLGVALVARQPVRLAQADEPLVAVELPDDLAVPHARGVEEVDVGSSARAGPAATHRIEVPVDRIAEGQPAIAEQVEAPSEKRLGLVDERRFGPGHTTAQLGGPIMRSRPRRIAPAPPPGTARAAGPPRRELAGAHPRADRIERGSGASASRTPGTGQPSRRARAGRAACAVPARSCPRSRPAPSGRAGRVSRAISVCRGPALADSGQV